MELLLMNWGHGITIFLVIFVGFMAFMVYKSAQYDTELVTENYYEEEINYQSKIDKRNLAKKEGKQFDWKVENGNLVLIFPDTETEGSVTFFRPSNKSKDFKIELAATDSNRQDVPLEKFIPGQYQVQLDWISEGKEYYQEGNIFIP